jgi:hypothetical protein
LLRVVFSLFTSRGDGERPCFLLLGDLERLLAGREDFLLGWRERDLSLGLFGE